MRKTEKSEKMQQEQQIAIFDRREYEKIGQKTFNLSCGMNTCNYFKE